MSVDDFDPLTRAVLEGGELGVFEDDTGRALVDLWRYKVCDPAVERMIFDRVRSAKLREAFRSEPFQVPRLAGGGLYLGENAEAGACSIPLSYANAHTLVIANSGAGKTTRSRLTALQVAPRVDGMWLFDLRKREFRVLRPLLERVGVELVVVPARACKINPLEPPRGVHRAAWASMVSDLLINVLVLPQRASKLIHKHILTIQRGFEGAESPTCFDLFEAVRADRTANGQARAAVLDALEPVLLSLGPGVLGYRLGWRTEDLGRRKIVFEFADVTEEDKNLLINTLVVGEFARRVASGASNVPMDLWICCDEGQRLCGGVLDDLIGLVRGAGIGLDLSVLSPAGVSPQVLANTSVKVMGRCGHLGDYAAAGRCLGLDPEQVRWAQHHLGPGRFIVALGEGDWRRPFPIQIPTPAWPKETHSDPSETGLGLPVVSAAEFVAWPSQATEPRSGSGSTPSGDPMGRSAGRLTEDEHRLCVAVRDHPLRPASAYARIARMNASRAVRIRESLVERGYLRKHTLETGGPGRAAALLELTQEGVEAVRLVDEGH